MAIVLNPYLSFRDNAREALEFYHGVFGGDLTISVFADTPGMTQDPSEHNKVMHGQLTTERGLTIMASDTPNAVERTEGNNISVSLSGDDETTLRTYWESVSEGGTVTMPLSRAPWGDSFGMCVDRFGVNWLVNIAGSAGGGEQPNAEPVDV
jgi:PhnB protein